MTPANPALCLAAALFAHTAHAQAGPPAGPPPGAGQPAGDRVTLGFGLGISADHEGSDDYELQPGGILQGEVAGIDFQMRGLNLYTNFVPDRLGSGTRFILGPVVQVRLDRSGEISDPRVAQLGPRDTAVEVGLYAGVSQRGVLIPPASLTFDVTFLHDVAGAHRSYLITPSLALSSPVSRRSFARLGVSADYAGGGYASTYFDVAPGNVLAPYATTGSGWKSAGISLLYTHDLGGNPREGLGLFGLANYKRLLGQFADSPIVRDAGSASQGFAVAGISYSF